MTIVSCLTLLTLFAVGAVADSESLDLFRVELNKVDDSEGLRTETQDLLLPLLSQWDLINQRKSQINLESEAGQVGSLPLQIGLQKLELDRLDLGPVISFPPQAFGPQPETGPQYVLTPSTNVQVGSLLPKISTPQSKTPAWIIRVPPSQSPLYLVLIPENNNRNPNSLAQLLTDPQEPKSYNLAKDRLIQSFTSLSQIESQIQNVTAQIRVLQSASQILSEKDVDSSAQLREDQLGPQSQSQDQTLFNSVQSNGSQSQSQSEHQTVLNSVQSLDSQSQSQFQNQTVNNFNQSHNVLSQSGSQSQSQDQSSNVLFQSGSQSQSQGQTVNNSVQSISSLSQSQSQNQNVNNLDQSNNVLSQSASQSQSQDQTVLNSVQSINSLSQSQFQNQTVNNSNQSHNVLFQSGSQSQSQDQAVNNSVQSISSLSQSQSQNQNVNNLDQSNNVLSQSASQSQSQDQTVLNSVQSINSLSQSQSQNQTANNSNQSNNVLSQSESQSQSQNQNVNNLDQPNNVLSQSASQSQSQDQTVNSSNQSNNILSQSASQSQSQDQTVLNLVQSINSLSQSQSQNQTVNNSGQSINVLSQSASQSQLQDQTVNNSNQLNNVLSQSASQSQSQDQTVLNSVQSNGSQSQSQLQNQTVNNSGQSNNIVSQSTSQSQSQNQTVLSSVQSNGSQSQSQSQNQTVNNSVQSHDSITTINTSVNTVKSINQHIVDNPPPFFTLSDIKDDAKLKTIALVDKYGYPSGTHYVYTEDGYKLCLHRMPRPGAPPVLLVHGLMSSSASWIQIGPSNGLAYILYRKGYDVWMLNTRGNIYSREHKNKTVKPRDYWDFSFHEIGKFDLPSSIDLILEITNQPKVQYIGHSQGSTVFFVMCSERPEYASKVNLMQSLAPTVYLKDNRSPVLKFLGMFRGKFSMLVNLLGGYEISSKTRLIKQFREHICGTSELASHICAIFDFVLCGFDWKNFNETLTPIVESHASQGASAKLIYHYAQMQGKLNFQLFDHGRILNRIRYNANVPPLYNLSMAASKVVVHHSGGDWLGADSDVAHLVKRLPNLVESRKVQIESFAHFDFTISKDVRSLVYDSVVGHLENHRF